MGLVDEQHLFLVDVGKLIARAVELGFKITSGEMYRTPLQAWINSQPSGSKVIVQTPDNRLKSWTESVGGVGSATSNHMRRLAFDINFFAKEGGVPINDPQKIRPLGEYWESLSDKNRWGGFFRSANGYPANDIYHFERNV